MKIAVTLILFQTLLIQFGMAEFTEQKYRELHNTCVDRSGVDEDLIVRGRKGDFVPDLKFKLFLKCCFDEWGALDATGNVLVQNILDAFHENLVEKYGPSMWECVEEVSHAGDTLDYIYNYCYCGYEKTKEKFDIP